LLGKKLAKEYGVSGSSSKIINNRNGGRMVRSPRRSLINSLAVAILFLATSSVLVNAQSSSTATINGTVTDPQGAVIPNATVTATNLATGVERSATTSASGFYRILSLQPGTYDLRVDAAGFSKAITKNILLQVGEQRDFNFNVGLAASATSIEVTAQAPLVETTKTDVSTNLSATNIRDLPSFAGAAGGANDYAGLALTAPGVKYDTSSVSGDLIGPGSINNRYNLYNVDGGTINDAVDSGRTTLGASVDEVQEFQVLTNNYNAEYGQAGGLILNVVTKSGSNSLHGEGHIYFRGRNLGASQYFYNLVEQTTPPVAHPSPVYGDKAPFHRQEGGGTLGGPIIKDRTFWFVSYEKTNQGFPLILTPPSGALSIGQPTKELQYSGKLDHRLSKNNLITARFNVDRFVSDNVVVQTGNNITPDSLTSQVSHVSGINVSWTSSITPNLVNEARFFRNRQLTGTPDKSTLPGQQHAGFYLGSALLLSAGGSEQALSVHR